MTDRRVTQIGDDAIAVSGLETSQLRALSHELRQSGEWLEVVDGIADVTILFDPAYHSPNEVRERVRLVDARSVSREHSIQPIELPVAFGGESGPDLQSVCDALNLLSHDLILELCHADLFVDMMGFTPGFAYIGGVPDRLNVPRLAQPRTRVPAGSLGLAAGKCGTYALDGPGGWPIIGRVLVPLFDPDKDNPFLLEAGQTIRLVAEQRS